MSSQRAIVLGIHSFLDIGPKVGTQYIAQGLAINGWKVDYVSIGSSLFDTISRQRRKRFHRVWLKHQDTKGWNIQPNLTEYAFRTPHPANKFFLNNAIFFYFYSCLSPSWLRKRHYDICIHDITANIFFLNKIRSDLFILRLNDLPEGFAFQIHKKMIDSFKKKIASLAYHEIWAVSDPLSEYALDLNPGNIVAVLPNGIEERFLCFGNKVNRPPKKAVFLGHISPWIDLELIEKTAILLPDWKFDVFGSFVNRKKPRIKNLNFFGPIGREHITTLLRNYQVGLIPFRDICGRMKYVERPIKFYEYIAAGLGVACVDVGSLKTGIGDWASYGNTPKAFARAIIRESSRVNQRSEEERMNFLKPFLWSNIIKMMQGRLEALGIDGSDVPK
jgi:hypothetical protein